MTEDWHEVFLIWDSPTQKWFGCCKDCRWFGKMSVSRAKAAEYGVRHSEQVRAAKK